MEPRADLYLARGSACLERIAQTGDIGNPGSHSCPQVAHFAILNAYI